MKKLIQIIVCLLVALFPASGFSAPIDGPEDRYFSDHEPDLTPQEEEGIAIVTNWQAREGNTKPAPGPDGSVQFLYGASQPSIVCAVLQVCDIELQPGEQVNSIHIGDAARWNIEPAITGSGENEVQHLVVKPMDVGLSTSLMVTTNRRTYHMGLRSTRKDYMSRVSFAYIDDAMKKWQASNANKEADYKKKIIPETGEYLGNLNFGYRVEGDGSWKPMRVYNDGKKTIMEMPPGMSQTGAPTLLVVRNEGGVFGDDEQTMVNYRVQNNRYIVDSLFDKAILIAGVGSNQNRVTITKEQ